MLTRKSAAVIVCAWLASITAANATQLKHGQCDNDGRCVSFAPAKEYSAHASKRRAHRVHRTKRHDVGGAAVVASRSGVRVRVAPSARAALQCVVDHVEAAGVRIKFMRGYGPGTVKGSLHPGGRAIDINQLARNVTRPVVPVHVANAAGDVCGLISGARWGYQDTGHWNMPGRVAEPWPRILASK